MSENERSEPDSRGLQTNANDSANHDPSDGFSVDLSEMIGELGRGLAEAQRQLDISSMEVQNRILEDERLSEYGINATWYTIPEATFTLSMEYKVTEERQSTEDKKKRFRVIPSNATYNNTFKSEGRTESNVSLKFVPVPPNDQLIRRVKVPDLVGKLVSEARSELSDIGIEADFSSTDGSVKDSMKVTSQSLEAGKYMPIGKRLTIKVEVQK